MSAIELFLNELETQKKMGSSLFIKKDFTITDNNTIVYPLGGIFLINQYQFISSRENAEKYIYGFEMATQHQFIFMLKGKHIIQRSGFFIADSFQNLRPNNDEQISVLFHGFEINENVNL